MSMEQRDHFSNITELKTTLLVEWSEVPREYLRHLNINVHGKVHAVIRFD